MTRRRLPQTCLLVAALATSVVLASCGRRAALAEARAAADLAAPTATLAAASSQTVSVGDRPFNLYTPQSLEGRAGPLVLALHGGLGSAAAFQQGLPLQAAADSAGFRVAYLNGTPQRMSGNRLTWNAGACCGRAAETGVDDLGYLQAVISTLVAQGLADPSEVYLVGHSNGAMLAYSFICTRPGQVRGVVALAGALVVPDCRGASGTKVLHVHGTSDNLVPPGGGGAGDRLMSMPFRPLQQTLDTLRAAGASVSVIELPGAEHGYQSLDQALQSQRGEGLQQLIADFVRAG